MTSLGTFWYTLWRFVRPEIEELIIYTLVILSFIGTAYYQTIVKNVTGGSEDVSMAFALIQEQFTFLTEGDDTVAKFFTFGLWFIIGTAVYILVWFLITFSSGAFHDVEVSKSFVHPSSFKRSDYWLSIMGRVVLRGAAAFSLLFYVSLWCALIAPVWLASFKEPFITGFSLETIIDFSLALVGVALSLHIAAILLRLVLLRSSYTYEK